AQDDRRAHDERRGLRAGESEHYCRGARSVMQVRCRHVDHVQVCIPPGAEETARAFYVNVLGFHPIEKPESLRSMATMWFQNGDVEFHVATDPVTQRTKQHPALVVEGIDAVRDHLVKQGVT